jgi:multicomponent Na+:H+ antiporter subunit C
MTFAPDPVLIIVIGVLAAGGVYLLLERSLSRVAIGIILLGNAVNIFFLVVGGPPGEAPIVGKTPLSEMSDPLPQAMVLTAIVITLAMTGFLLAMAYRSWQLNEHDEVQDDLEDRRIARLAAITTVAD